MERVERLRRMQSIFNLIGRKISTEGATRDGAKIVQMDISNIFSANYSLYHHYAILGLSRSRTNPYTDDEIKMAFRNKAKQYHPDQNQENKEVAEARFKEVMSSYEAIKSERMNIK